MPGIETAIRATHLLDDIDQRPWQHFEIPIEINGLAPQSVRVKLYATLALKATPLIVTKSSAAAKWKVVRCRNYT